MSHQLCYGPGPKASMSKDGEDGDASFGPIRTRNLTKIIKQFNMLKILQKIF